jgi:hypothetical protein
MLSFVRAVWYFIRHPLTVLDLTVVRRYADAQNNFIGELYEGHDRTSRMIGYSCDNWPLDADMSPLPLNPRLCYDKSFLDPLPANTLRVGAIEPENNSRVQEYVALRRYLPLRVTVLNRFVEHVMEIKHV